MRKLRALLAAIVLGVVPATASAAAHDGLPAGVSLAKSEDGLALSSAEGALYRLDLDRIARRIRPFGIDSMRRCADVCAKYWRPFLVDAAFKPVGDWGVVQRENGRQLSYRGEPLYTFTGRSFDEIAGIPVVPSYMSGYAGKPTALVDGVPVATLYWHRALYQPPEPAYQAPAGVMVQWAKASYVFVAQDKRGLYTSVSRQDCAAGCDGMQPLAAPMVAQPVGAWKPVESRLGDRYWAYGGRVVYEASEADAKPAAGRWAPLEVR